MVYFLHELLILKAQYWVSFCGSNLTHFYMKINQNYPRYKALLQKKSYRVGCVIWKKGDSKVAPLIDKDCKLIGALAVFKYIESILNEFFFKSHP